MKFPRRPDLDPPTRIQIVMLAWRHQGVYGKMTHIATYYRISRTLLYHLLLAANRQLAVLFSDETLLLQKDQQPFEHLLLLFRLEGNCSLLSISAILQALDYPPHSVGALRQFFHSAGQMLPSTLSMPSKTVVFYLRDAMFAVHVPLLLPIDAQSTTIFNIELAADRSAETWRAHFEALEQHHFVSLGMASERGLGRVAGSQTAGAMPLWVAEDFHEFRALFEGRHQLERKAYAAIAKEDDAARKFAGAKSETPLAKRLQPYDSAPQACEQAIARYDQLAMRRHLLREAFHVCSPQGRRRPQENVRSELRLLFDLIQALDCAAIPPTLTPLRTHIDDMVVPFKHADAIATERRGMVPHEAVDLLVLAWHHEHLSSPSGSKPKRYFQKERDFWLAGADGLLGDAFDTLTALGFAKLDTIVRAAARVEMVNSRMRPYLNSCKGQITQETLNLSMFSHNHRRDKSGKRQGKAPLERLTGKPFEAPWWDLLRRRGNAEQGVTAPCTLPSKPPRPLVTHNEGDTDQQAIASDQALLDPTSVSESECHQKDAQAASVCPRW